MQLAITSPHVIVFSPYGFIYKCQPFLPQSPAGREGERKRGSGTWPGEDVCGIALYIS